MEPCLEAKGATTHKDETHWGFRFSRAAGCAMLGTPGTSPSILHPPDPKPVRQRGPPPPSPRWLVPPPSLTLRGGGGGVQTGSPASGPRPFSYRWLLFLSIFLELSPSPTSLSCWLSLLLRKTWKKGSQSEPGVHMSGCSISPNLIRGRAATGK